MCPAIDPGFDFLDLYTKFAVPEGGFVYCSAAGNKRKKHRSGFGRNEANN
jgi:hypothetical protein